MLAVAKKTRGPLHLVGHSYGAALVLEAARPLGSRVKSLTLVEPVSFHLLRQEGRPEWADIEQLGKAVLGGVAQGHDREAAAAFMSYWLGRWRWRLSPKRFKRAIDGTIPKVALESPQRDAAKCQGRNTKGRWPYEPVHPSRRAQPADTRPSCGSALTGLPSPSPSSSTSRANSSSSSFAWDMALARTFSRSV